MEPKDLFKIMVEKNASDLFIRPGGYLYARILTEVKPINDHRFSVEEVKTLVTKWTDAYEKEMLLKTKNCEFATFFEGGDKRWRFRISIFYQKNNFAIVIRKIDLNLLSFEELNLPAKVLEKLCCERRGMILLTGITGSGKSTTIAAMIEYINRNFGKHILTVEEPIEFVFEDKKSMINHREIGRDVLTYADSLKQAAFHSPDVIYIGNIKDMETCHAALTAAETGALVFSTMHSVNAASTVERLVNFFPAEQHNFIFTQLSLLLKGVVSLRLLPRADGEGLLPAYEVMTLSPTISSLISKALIREIPEHIGSSEIFGMNSFNKCLMELIRKKKISIDVALDNSDDQNDLTLQLKKENFI